VPKGHSMEKQQEFDRDLADLGDDGWELVAVEGDAAYFKRQSAEERKKVPAIARVPAERRPPEPPGLIDQEKDDLEGVREADVVEFCRCGEGDRRIAGVESSAEATVG
jgi:hypothetical protein